MSYFVKEIFYTLQGEGANAGRPAVFCRFSGCNLWSGLESNRAAAICRFCDTDFVGSDGPRGGRYDSATRLGAVVASAWPGGSPTVDGALVVCTGGEPLLQLDANAIAAFHETGFQVAVETNGTRPGPEGIDWLTVSPKAGTDLILAAGDELKLVYPQPGIDPRDFEALRFRHFLLQPMDGPDLLRNTRAAVRYCLDHPRWKLSLQIHKFLGLP